MDEKTLVYLKRFPEFNQKEFLNFAVEVYKKNVN